MAPAFAALAQKCPITTSFPDNLKCARIRPIPKVIGTTDPAEFRPVSILPGSSKVLESWLLARLRHYLAPSPFQFGFKARCSTEEALLTVEHLVSEGLRACPHSARVLMVLFDLRRAFDSCVHNILLQVLIDRGVPSDLLQMVSSYLSNRCQFVQVGGACSGTTAIPSGVAQGSLLGPFLFNVLVDEVFRLARLSAGGELVLYADDTAYIRPLSDLNAELDAQSDVMAICSAFQTLGLSINALKTKYLIISPTGSTEIWLAIHGQQLRKEDSAKYLGVMLDSQFSFRLHAQHKALCLKHVIGALHRCIGIYLPKRVYLRLYLQKLLPQLTYALAVFAPRFKYSWTQLESVQRFALRCAAFSMIISHHMLIFCELRIFRPLLLFGSKGQRDWPTGISIN